MSAAATAPADAVIQRQSDQFVIADVPPSYSELLKEIVVHCMRRPETAILQRLASHPTGVSPRCTCVKAKSPRRSNTMRGTAGVCAASRQGNRGPHRQT